MLNRAALILRYKQPFVDWINAVDPSPASHTLNLAEVNQEHTVYLVEVEDEGELDDWLARHHEELFEEELQGWYTDPALWPRTGRYGRCGSGVRSSSTPSWWMPLRRRSKTTSSKTEAVRNYAQAFNRSFRPPHALADAMDERYSAFVYVGAYLGLRWGELAGLRRQHLHLLKKQMKVVGSLERFDNSYRYVEETKTTSSRRMIPVPEFLRDILAAHLAVAPRSKFVFPAPKGRLHPLPRVAATVLESRG